jgi:beta-glucosidase
VVVLKNDKNVLPLKKDAKVNVAGSKANDMGAQCGGWTVGWQGHLGAVTPGTTIQRAIEKAVASHTLVQAPDSPMWSWSSSAKRPMPRAPGTARI